MIAVYVLVLFCCGIAGIVHGHQMPESYQQANQRYDVDDKTEIVTILSTDPDAFRAGFEKEARP